jgi:hypothetical protein
MPADHPLRSIKARADAALRAIDPVLKQLNARGQPPTVKVAWVLYGQLLIALYGIASDRAFCAELRANRAFRNFLNMRPWDATPDWWEFARERRRLADSIIGRCFLNVVFTWARNDGTLYSTEFAANDELIRTLAPVDCIPRRREGVVET